MTVYAGLDEETLRTSTAVGPFRANAFRVLSTNADTESRQVEKQQTRLLIAIEFDPRRVEGAYGLKDLAQPEVSEAGYLLAQHDSRMLEDLFWVHALDWTCVELPPRLYALSATKRDKCYITP